MTENVFWDIKTELSQIKRILADESHPRFIEYASLLLARTNKMKDVFSDYLSKAVFCRNWRKIKNRMRLDQWAENRVIFWDEVYRVLYKEIPKSQRVMLRKDPLPTNPRIKKVGAVLKAARMKKGWSQQQLAERTGLSQQTLSLMENGLLNFSFETFIKVISTLGMRLSLTPKTKQVL